MDCEPLVALMPDHAPEAVQDEELVADQLRVALPPLAIVLGLAVRVTVGAVTGLTVTLVDCVALPPAPVHESVKVASAVRAPVDCEPAVALAPDQLPEAVHEVALAADHVRVELLPLATVLGLALKLIVGAAALMDTVVVCVALPPAPLQLKVYVEVLVSAPVDCEPLVALAPDQAPEAAQEVALEVDQTRFALLPLTTELGLALKLTVGAAALMDTVVVCAALPPAPAQVRV